MKKLVLATLASTFLFTSYASALPLKYRKLAKEQEKRMDDKVKKMNSKCGTEIASKVDWSTMKKEDIDKGVAGWAEALYGGIKTICSDDDGKKAVQTSVKNIVINRGEKRAIAIKDGTLTYTMNLASSNDEAFVKKYLENNL